MKSDLVTAVLSRERENMSRPSNSRRRLAKVAALVTALVLSTVNMADAAGTPSASKYSLSTGPTYQSTGDKVHRFVSFTFTIVNGNSREIRIRQIGRNGPGLQLLVPAGSGMNQKFIPPTGPGVTRVIPAHKSIRLTVWYRVSDCAKVPHGSWPLAMNVAWSSGQWQQVALQMPSAYVPWPRSITGFVCS